MGYGQPFRIPIPWLTAGNTNTWSTVTRLIQALVNETGRLYARPNRSPLNPNGVPVAGEYDFMPVTSPNFTWARGPDGRYQSRSHKEGDPFDDTASLSTSQISNLQADLRDLLLVRDGACPVSGKGFSVCDAAHLAPKRREDIYETVLGQDYNESPYKVNMVILMNQPLHKACNRFACSFLPIGDSFIFHVFKPMSYVEEYHGTIVLPSAFSLNVGDLHFDLPDKRLMDWHYDQCCPMHVRGFSAGMQVSERSTR